MRLLLEEVRKTGESSWIDKCFGVDSVSISNSMNSFRFNYRNTLSPVVFIFLYIHFLHDDHNISFSPCSNFSSKHSMHISVAKFPASLFGFSPKSGPTTTWQLSHSRLLQKREKNCGCTCFPTCNPCTYSIGTKSRTTSCWHRLFCFRLASFSSSSSKNWKMKPRIFLKGEIFSYPHIQHCE
jgi:hypothetical protein